MATIAEILNGADFEGWEAGCNYVMNAIKNHYRVSDPCVNMVARQPGEILSDPDDDKLHHVGGASGYPCDEILQATRSCDVIPEFKGVDFYDVCNGDYATIRGIDEPGLGHRLTIGLDETTRTMVICDLGDIDVDFGLAVQSSPSLIIFRENATFLNNLRLIYNSIITNTNELFLFSGSQITFQGSFATATNPYKFKFTGGALTDDNAEQSWIYADPEINQTLTAGYVAVLVDVTETSLGDGSAGAGYNALMDLRVAGTTQFGIQNAGEIMTNQVEAGAIGAYDRRIPIYDETGSLEGYVALYAAP